MDFHHRNSAVAPVALAVLDIMAVVEANAQTGNTQYAILDFTNAPFAIPWVPKD